MKRLLPILLLALLSAAASGQNPEIKRTWHWYFGNGAGLDFSGGSVVADTNSPINRLEGVSAISDTSGNLLFYTDGLSVWNSNHQVMPNGDNLMALGTPRQSSVIVPQPGNDNIYYIFTIGGFEFGGNGLMYSIVNMTLDGGLGDISAKNIFLFGPNCEILAAVKHDNCEDVWVMAHERYNNCFRAYLVTSAGVDTTPVINCIGNAGPFSPYGYMAKFSPDGSKLVTTVPAPLDSANQIVGVYTVEVYHFDNATGILSDKILIHNPLDTFTIGMSFSPDNSKLYVLSANYDINIDAFRFYQYDLSVWDSSAVAATKTTIFLNYTQDYADVQITPNGKIFAARIWTDTISIIENPNVAGVGCNFVDKGLSLDGKLCYVGLPNFIESYFDTVTCYTGFEENNETLNLISIYPNPFNESTTVFVPNYSGSRNRITVELYNMLGQKLPLQTNSAISGGDTQIIISRGNLVNGIYLLRVQMDNQIFSQNLILTH